jgi:hypothetical protein
VQPKPNTHCTVRRSPGILIVPSLNLALSQFTQKIDHVFHTVSPLTENGYIRLSDKTAGAAYSGLYYDCVHHQSYLPLPPSKRLQLLLATQLPREGSLPLRSRQCFAVRRRGRHS